MKIRYVARAIGGIGWRVWDRKMQKWWGNYFKNYPIISVVIEELNGQKRTDVLIKLCKQAFVKNSED